MQVLDRYLSMARDKGMDHAIVVKTSEVYTAPWVRMKCQYGCTHYNKSLCCPPRTPTPAETRSILDSYSCAILLHKLWGSETRDIKSFNESAVEIELALFFDGYYKAFCFGSGFCRRCEKCNLTEGCVYSGRARPSMEACGIDVFATAAAEGLIFPVLKDTSERRNSFAIILVE